MFDVDDATSETNFETKIKSFVTGDMLQQWLLHQFQFVFLLIISLYQNLQGTMAFRTHGRPYGLSYRLTTTMKACKVAITPRTKRWSHWSSWLDGKGEQAKFWSKDFRNSRIKRRKQRFHRRKQGRKERRNFWPSKKSASSFQIFDNVILSVSPRRKLPNGACIPYSNVEFRCHAIALWMVIILSTGKMHCCIYITMLIIFLMEGPVRLAIATPILKITRRKGLYLFVSASSFSFLGESSSDIFQSRTGRCENFELGTLLLDDFGGDNMDLVKLIFGVSGKFLLTMYFPISYTYIGQVFSILTKPSGGPSRPPNFDNRTVVWKKYAENFQRTPSNCFSGVVLRADTVR